MKPGPRPSRPSRPSRPPSNGRSGPKPPRGPGAGPARAPYRAPRGPGGPPPRAERRLQRAPRNSLNIVYEDGDLIIVDKPPGLLSTRTPDDERESLFDIVKEHVRGPRKRPVRIWIIHRLDKEASGLLVFAKSEKAFNWLKEDLRAKRMHRLYTAVVEGEITAQPLESHAKAEAGPESQQLRPRIKQLPSGTIQSFMKDDEFGNVTSVGIGEVARETARARRSAGPSGPRHAERFMGKQDDDAPRLAVTHYRVLGTGEGRSLLQLRLDTGRKNQIRVHMQEFKHPIIGDARYGASTDPIGRLALHATELGFTHPTKGQSVRFSSPAPASFYRALGMQPPSAAPEETLAPSTPTIAPTDLSASVGGVAPAALAPSMTPAPTPPAAAAPPSPAADTSWDHVAAWYDELIEDNRSDHFRHTIMPGTLRLLRADRPEGFRVLDIACGQGALCRRMAELGMDATGVDASTKLIETARRRPLAAPGKVRFEVGDARALLSLPTDARSAGFDAATCVMALMNIDPLEPVLRGAAAVLRPGGAFIAVILHPAFRAPGQTSWGWDEGAPHPDRSRKRPQDRAQARQYRRVDGYLSLGQIPITMNPGKAAHGAAPVTTWTFHRPIQAYVKAFADAGFLVEALEEWPSMRSSQAGPRAAEENRARREIPMFLGIRAIRQG